MLFAKGQTIFHVHEGRVEEVRIAMDNGVIVWIEQPPGEMGMMSAQRGDCFLRQQDADARLNHLNQIIDHGHVR